MWLVDAASPSNWGDRVFYWRGTEGYSTPARSPWRRWVESSLRYADACLMPPLWPPGRLGHVSLRAGPRTNQSNAADISSVRRHRESFSWIDSTVAVQTKGWGL